MYRGESPWLGKSIAVYSKEILFLSPFQPVEIRSALS